MAKHDHAGRNLSPLENIPGLPPLPDAQTGEPFPPDGRAFVSAWKEPVNQQDRWPYRKPESPADLGPMLFWRSDRIWIQLLVYVAWVVLIMVGVGVVAAVQGDEFYGPFTAWPVWLVAIVAAYFVGNPLSLTWASAGAYWFQWGQRKQWYHRLMPNKRRSQLVHLYDLVQVSIDPGRTQKLTLADAHGNVISLPVFQYQHDRRIWALIYNGILYSYANGANADPATVKLLEIDKTPAYDVRRSNSILERKQYNKNLGIDDSNSSS